MRKLTIATRKASSAIKDFTLVMLRMKDKEDKIKKQNRRFWGHQKRR